jgi:hypothetical protein
MSRRSKSSTFKFNQPLLSPPSKFVYYCYGVHGKGYGIAAIHRPYSRSMHAPGDARGADGSYSVIDRFTSESMRGKTEWSMLGWVPTPTRSVKRCVEWQRSDGERIPVGVV